MRAAPPVALGIKTVIVGVFVLYVEITHLAGPIWSIVARHHTGVIVHS